MTPTPYRSGDDAPRYVCIVCFKSISTGPGNCPGCGAPLSSLDDLEVATTVRNCAIAERAKINRKKNLTIIVPTGMLSILIFIGLVAAGIPVDHEAKDSLGGEGLWFPFLCWAVLAVIFASIYPSLFKRTQARLKFDPVNAELPSVLEWLGLRVEGGKAGM